MSSAVTAIKILHCN